MTTSEAEVKVDAAMADVVKLLKPQVRAAITGRAFGELAISVHVQAGAVTHYSSRPHRIVKPEEIQ